MIPVLLGDSFSKADKIKLTAEFGLMFLLSFVFLSINPLLWIKKMKKISISDAEALEQFQHFKIEFLKSNPPRVNIQLISNNKMFLFRYNSTLKM